MVHSRRQLELVAFEIPRFTHQDDSRYRAQATGPDSLSMCPWSRSEVTEYFVGYYSRTPIVDQSRLGWFPVA